MDSAQKRTLTWILLLGLAYFAVFIFPNALGARSERMLLATSLDEPITYPHVVRMLTPASDWKDLFSRWVIYGDYHYGYPFYLASALVVLPVRLIHGALFTNFTQINLLLLRQLISVLPMLAAVILLVYAQTRFHSTWLSVGLMVFILSTPALVRNNIQWWHPDALSVLSVTMVFVFLQQDQLRFGRAFFLAAVACGVGVGIKGAGAFFGLAIPLYLVMGIRQKRLNLVQAAGRAGLFVGAAALALVLSNPFLYNAGARQEALDIQLYKTTELDQGYSDESPYYAKGPAFWEWTLSTWYAHPLMLAFLTISLFAGCVWGPNRTLNRLILAYMIPFSVYLLWFVAVKPDHYWLPVLIPLYSAAFSLPLALQAGRLPGLKGRPRTARWAAVIVLVLLAGQVVVNLAKPYSGAVAQYTQSLKVEEMFSQ